jgi:hypothetical protein
LAPWSAEVTPNCFVVHDANSQALTYVYYENKPARELGCSPQFARNPRALYFVRQQGGYAQKHHQK